MSDEPILVTFASADPINISLSHLNEKILTLKQFVHGLVRYLDFKTVTVRFVEV